MINFETCRIWNGNTNDFESIGSKSEFDRLFPKYQVNGFARFADANDKMGWVNEKGEQIGQLPIDRDVGKGDTDIA